MIFATSWNKCASQPIVCFSNHLLDAHPSRWICLQHAFEEFCCDHRSVLRQGGCATHNQLVIAIKIEWRREFLDGGCLDHLVKNNTEGEDISFLGILAGI